MSVPPAFIVSPLRTPVGKFGGQLAAMPAHSLAARVMAQIIERSGIDPQTLDDVIVAQSYANSEAPCMGRYAALAAGLPVEVPGFTLDRRCGSGLQAVIEACMQVQTGVADALLVVGVESMSNVEFYSTDMRRGRRMGSSTLFDRLERGRVRSQPEERFGPFEGTARVADSLATRYGISREASDQFALESHRKAADGWKHGHFDDEVVSVHLLRKDGVSVSVERDEGVREQASMEDLSALPALRQGGIVTAGNACQQNDAAAGCLVVSEAYLNKHGLIPIGRLVGWAAAGCDPLNFGIGPVPAVRRLLDRTGLELRDMGRIEVNEAFASQVLAVLIEWGLTADPRVNVNGSGISLGHPIGATGTRILATMLHDMRRSRVRYGLETMCIGGGQGLAAIFESLA